MGIYGGLDGVREEIIKCMKCGNCLAVCPIYKENKREAASARGKVQMADAILKGEIGCTAGIADRLALCLTCRACVAACPSGVEADQVVLSARAEVVRQRGLPRAKGAIFAGLKRRKLFHAALRVGARLQRLGLARIDRDKARPRFPIGLDTRRVIAPLAAVSLRQQLPSLVGGNGAGLRVGFFTGCLINYLYTDIGQAVVQVLDHYGARVIIPPDQHCCGTPVMVHGDAATARDMARSQVNVFSAANVDVIVVACPTCGCAFKHNYPALLEGDRVYRERAQGLAAITYDITELLVDKLGMGSNPPGSGKSHTVPGTGKLRVTYHDPCHLVRSQRLKVQPREMLRAVPGVSLVEMKAPDRCCGGAGSFSLTHYDISMRIGARKAADIGATGAAVVATSCPGCRMHITDVLSRHGMAQRVVHPVQLLAEACRAGSGVGGERGTAHG